MSEKSQSNLATAHLSDGSMICVAYAKMDVPSGGAHTRSVAIWTPAFDLSACDPVVTATVYAPQSAGTTFAVYNINVNPIGELTQIAVSAQNIQLGVESSLDFYCNVIACGRPVQGASATVRPGRVRKKRR